MAGLLSDPINAVKQRFENQVYGVLQKYGYPPFGRHTRHRQEQTEPPYAYQVDPQWLKNVANGQSILNNSVETKVHQALRRGFTSFEKKYYAKCPECQTEFQSFEPFKLEDGISDDKVDLDTDRVCPECNEMVNMTEPDPGAKAEAKHFFQRANMHDKDESLEPRDQTSISQTFLEVCEEVARDIQIYDDGWMIFERSYVLEEDGSVFEWELQDVYNTPAYLMRYSVDDTTGKIGGEYWVCLKCKAESPQEYAPEETPGECEECGNRTYEVFAYLLNDVNGDPVDYFIRGEFAHASEYQPSFLYGYSPILSVWQEARTLENMDEWYQEAYEERRAPRGAISVSSSNAESVRAWNTEQMQKLNADSNHIPTFIDDTDSGSDPLSFIPLLENPAEMQHMEMREWFKDRIAAKYGVSQVFQTGGAEGSGMSQSLEIEVTNRSLHRLQSVFNDVFIPALLGQVKANGWTRELAPPEPEDEQAQATLTGRHLNNLQVAQQLGLEAEWTDEDEPNIKAGEIELEGEGEGMMDQLAGGGGAPGGGGEAPSGGGTGQTTPAGGRPDEANERGGQPSTPRDPSTENPYNRQDTGGGGGSVTTGSSGYSNASYSSDDEGEVIDYLEHVRQMLAENGTSEKAVNDAIEAYRTVEYGPSVQTIRNAVAATEKSFQDLRQKDGAGWADDYERNAVVMTMYDIMSHE